MCLKNAESLMLIPSLLKKLQNKFKKINISINEQELCGFVFQYCVQKFSLHFSRKTFANFSTDLKNQHQILCFWNPHYIVVKQFFKVIVALLNEMAQKTKNVFHKCVLKINIQFSHPCPVPYSSCSQNCQIRLFHYAHSVEKKNLGKSY